MFFLGWDMEERFKDRLVWGKLSYVMVKWIFVVFILVCF